MPLQFRVSYSAASAATSGARGDRYYCRTNYTATNATNYG